jgi:DNA-directed RNA polymerase specialized sigma subunit
MEKPELEKHRLLREIVRNYLVFEDYCSQYGTYTIEHKGITVSFLDLHNALKTLSPRKKEAIYYNVILDWKQKDVAEKMGITTVSVGQYVDQGMVQLCKSYFLEYE